MARISSGPSVFTTFSPGPRAHRGAVGVASPVETTRRASGYTDAYALRPGQVELGFHTLSRLVRDRRAPRSRRVRYLITPPALLTLNVAQRHYCGRSALNCRALHQSQ